MDRSPGRDDPVGVRRPEPVDQSGQNRYELIAGEEVARGVVLESQGALIGSGRDDEREQCADRRVSGAGVRAARRGQAQRQERLDHESGGLRIGLLRQRGRVRVRAPPPIGVLAGGEVGQALRFDARRQRALGPEPLEGERGALVVGSGEARWVFRAATSDSLVGQGPTAARALLGGQPVDGRRICRLPHRFQRGEDEALHVRADEEVGQLLFGPEQPRVRARGLLGSEQTTHQVGPPEVRRVDTQGVGVEDECGQLGWSVGPVGGDVGVGVGLHVGEGRLGARRVDVGGGQGQDAVDGGGERADAPVRCLLAGDPGGGGLGRRELGDLRRHRCGARRRCGGQQRGGRQEYGEANGGDTRKGASDARHGSRFPDLDPENSALAGSHRAPVPVSRRWELT